MVLETILTTLAILIGLFLCIYLIREKFSIKSITVLIIGIVLLVGIFIPLIVDFFEDTENVKSYPPSVMYYDDYFLGAESTTGVFELVNIDGKSYARASAVGNGTITVDGVKYDVTVEKAKLNVVMLIGQSNASYYRFTPNLSTPSAMMGQCYYYGSDYSPIYWGDGFTNTPSYDSSFDSYSMNDMIKGDKIQIGNVDYPFASTFVSLSKEKCYVINCGVISWSINNFVPNSIGWNYAKNVMENAISMIDLNNYIIVGYDYLWIQGEADSSMSVDEYVNKFILINDSFIDGSFGVIFDNGIISKTRNNDGVNSGIAQRKIPSLCDNVYLGSTSADSFTVSNGLMLSDDLHYSQLGDNIIGRDLAIKLEEVNENS